jgi:mitogen-activated protein kinase 1/3
MASSYHSFKVGASVASTTFEVPVQYQLVKPIGSGAYGVVISAIDEVSNHKVAIKKVQNSVNNNTDGKRIVREIRLLRMFQHDNIMNIHDLIMPPNVTSPQQVSDLYIVSELMSTDLYRIIYSNQPLSLDHTQYFIYQILRALKYMHSARVIHRDLKPSNILVNANCDIKLCDLGLARGLLNNDKEAEEELTEYVVTRWYRAPEIMLGCEAYSTAIDVWGVGCIFAELIKRRAIFMGDDYLDQLQRICAAIGRPSEAELEFVTSVRAKNYIMDLPNTQCDFDDRFPDLDPQAMDLLKQMLIFDPNHRISVIEALQHPYMASLHLPEDEPDAGFVFDWSYEQGKLEKSDLQQLVFDEVYLYHPISSAAESNDRNNHSPNFSPPRKNGSFTENRGGKSPTLDSKGDKDFKDIPSPSGPPPEHDYRTNIAEAKDSRDDDDDAKHSRDYDDCKSDPYPTY